MTQQPIRARSRPTDDHVRRDAVWKGNDLVFRRRIVASIEPDSKYPNMWRVRLPGGHVTDMVNLTRAKDAAVSLVAAEMAAAAPPIRPNREAAE
jgi:hypothetical protein